MAQEDTPLVGEVPIAPGEQGDDGWVELRRITSGPGDFGDLGRWLAATDPAGTKFLMFQLRGADGVAPHPREPGRWARTELVAPHGGGDDVTAFYAAIFGWTRDRDGTWRSEGTAVASSAPVPPGWPATRSSLWVTSFAVDDVAAGVERAIALGATRPVSRPDGSVLLLDDQRALFGLRPTSAAATRSRHAPRGGAAP